MRNLTKLYFTQTELESNEVDTSRLKNELDELRVRVRDKEKTIKQLQDDQNKQEVNIYLSRN